MVSFLSSFLSICALNASPVSPEEDVELWQDSDICVPAFLVDALYEPIKALKNTGKIEVLAQVRWSMISHLQVHWKVWITLCDLLGIGKIDFIEDDYFQADLDGMAIPAARGERNAAL
jgi:hypothetical protein